MILNKSFNSSLNLNTSLSSVCLTKQTEPSPKLKNSHELNVNKIFESSQKPEPSLNILDDRTSQAQKVRCFSQLICSTTNMQLTILPSILSTIMQIKLLLQLQLIYAFHKFNSLFKSIFSQIFCPSHYDISPLQKSRFTSYHLQAQSFFH